MLQRRLEGQIRERKELGAASFQESERFLEAGDKEKELGLQERERENRADFWRFPRSWDYGRKA